MVGVVAQAQVNLGRAAVAQDLARAVRAEEEMMMVHGVLMMAHGLIVHTQDVSSFDC